MANKGDLHQRDDDPSEPEWLAAIVVALLIAVLVGGYFLFRFLGYL